MNKEFIIISKDRHRDDIIYSFNGTYEEAKERSKKLLFEIKNYEYDENEYDDPNFLYSISMGGGDYAVEIYVPEKLKDSKSGDEGK